MKTIAKPLPKTAAEVIQAAASMFKDPAVNSVRVETPAGIFRVEKPGDVITPREVEIETMNAWFAAGMIDRSERGNENVYFTDMNGLPFFCKRF